MCNKSQVLESTMTRAYGMRIASELVVGRRVRLGRRKMQAGQNRDRIAGALRVLRGQHAAWRIAALGAAALLLTGCESLAITALGVGATTGISHTSGSISSRTFTASNKKVKAASLAALTRMGAKVENQTQTDTSEIISASYPSRSIEVEIETLSPSTTRVTATAKRGLFVYDAATANEIVEQTGRALSGRG